MTNPKDDELSPKDGEEGVNLDKCRDYEKTELTDTDLDSVSGGVLPTGDGGIVGIPDNPMNNGRPFEPRPWLGR